MWKVVTCLALFLQPLTCSTVSADPISLKAAFFSSDRSQGYRAAVKPFLDAVDNWAAASAHNRELLEMAREELARIRGAGLD